MDGKVQVFVLFRLSCVTAWGETVRVVGSCSSLGGWSPHLAIPLRTTEDSYPVWTSEPVLITALPGEIIEYKYIKGPEVVWERLQADRSLVCPLLPVTMPFTPYFMISGDEWGVSSGKPTSLMATARTPPALKVEESDEVSTETRVGKRFARVVVDAQTPNAAQSKIRMSLPQASSPRVRCSALKAQPPATPILRKTTTVANRG